MSVMTLSTHTHDLRRKPRQALLIKGHNVEFEVDTGSPIALTGETGWKKISSPRLARSYIRLCAYDQRQISVMGECTVDVKCGSTVLQLPLVVVSSGASLLGLNWKWSAECAAAFDELKQMLADKTRLVHFDPGHQRIILHAN